MLYTKKFVFTVSLCAMLAVNPVLAVTNPVEAKAGAFSGEVGKVGTVYSDWAGRADSGIAGVRYVNSAVDAAGNAAQWAENHAAAAAQSAQDAATSAAQAASKVAIAQGEDNKFKAMVTNGTGEVYAGYITSDMISSSGYIRTHSGVLITDSNAGAKWGKVEPDMINSSGYSGALIANASGVVEWGAIDASLVQFSGLEYTGIMYSGLVGFDGSGRLVPATPSTTGVLGAFRSDGGDLVAGFTLSPAVFGVTGGSITGYEFLSHNGSGVMGWGRIMAGAIDGGLNRGILVFDGSGTGFISTGYANTLWINNGEGVPMSMESTGESGDVLMVFSGSLPGWGKIGPESTTGIVGMVPVGSAGATTYGQLWIE